MSKLARFRSAVTGRFVTALAKLFPWFTVREKIK